jgi:hypothetical protein
VGTFGLAAGQTNEYALAFRRGTAQNFTLHTCSGPP